MEQLTYNAATYKKLAEKGLITGPILTDEEIEKVYENRMLLAGIFHTAKSVQLLNNRYPHYGWDVKFSTDAAVVQMFAPKGFVVYCVIFSNHYSELTLSLKEVK